MNDKEPNKNSQPTKTKSLTAIDFTSSEVADENSSNKNSLKPQCTLCAKDSEWVDILQTSSSSTKSIKNNNDRKVQQTIESEEGHQEKPLALMFPDLLENDPEMLEEMLNKVMSTTEVTKFLVGRKANFAFMKKVNRLIPPDKEWLEILTENSNSCCSIESELQDDGLSDFKEENKANGNNLDPKL